MLDKKLRCFLEKDNFGKYRRRHGLKKRLFFLMRITDLVDSSLLHSDKSELRRTKGELRWTMAESNRPFRNANAVLYQIS
jgi:hypothetical protein